MIRIPFLVIPVLGLVIFILVRLIQRLKAQLSLAQLERHQMIKDIENWQGLYHAMTVYQTERERVQGAIHEANNSKIDRVLSDTKVVDQRLYKSQNGV